MPEPHLRAADADRIAVADALGVHLSAGRLTVAEFDERIIRAYGARTYGELAELTADLPPVASGSPTPPATPPATGWPAPAPHRTAPARGACGGWAPSACGTGGWDGSHPWRSWLGTGLIVLAVWTATSLASGELRYFWPIWVIGPWGAMLLLQTMAGASTALHRPGRQVLPRPEVPARTGPRSRSERTSPSRQ